MCFLKLKCKMEAGSALYIFIFKPQANGLFLYRTSGRRSCFTLFQNIIRTNLKIFKSESVIKNKSFFLLKRLEQKQSIKIIFTLSNNYLSPVLGPVPEPRKVPETSCSPHSVRRNRPPRRRKTKQNRPRRNRCRKR